MKNPSHKQWCTGPCIRGVPQTGVLTGSAFLPLLESVSGPVKVHAKSQAAIQRSPPRIVPRPRSRSLACRSTAVSALDQDLEFVGGDELQSLLKPEYAFGAAQSAGTGASNCTCKPDCLLCGPLLQHARDKTSR